MADSAGEQLLQERAQAIYGTEGAARRVEAWSGPHPELLQDSLLDPPEAESVREELRHVMMHGMSGVRSRRSRLPYPASQLPEIAGRDLTFWAPVALAAYEGLKNVIHSHQQVHLADVRVFLQDEIEAAYQFLSRDETATLWRCCSRELADDIAGRRRPKMGRRAEG